MCRCEVCRESAADVAAVERSPAAAGVNFVMLNVDNPAFSPELATFDVNGIPKWVFLDAAGSTKGTSSGRTPRETLAGSVAALARGVPLPAAVAAGGASSGPASSLASPPPQLPPSPPVPAAAAQAVAEIAAAPDAAGVYAFTVADRTGAPTPLAQYKGTVTLIVNTASRCGLTASNYTALAALQDSLADKPFTVLAFPCNQFMNQEPGSIEQVCSLAERYGAKFPIFDKIKVRGRACVGDLCFYSSVKYRNLHDFPDRVVDFLREQNPDDFFCLQAYEPLL